MSGPALRGPFLTRREAARRAGSAVEQLVRRPDLLRLGGSSLEEVYFAFQFDESGVRPDLGRLVQMLRQDHDDIDIGHWLVEPQSDLGLATPLDWLAACGSEKTLMKCALESGPAQPAGRVGTGVVEDDEFRQLQPVPHRRGRRSQLKRPAAIGI
ncbi:MAG: hypothetical protein HKN91_12985 [Acidimicrobiia bacterium]|nr:hypothetical protein [Acidimicrobiia bacterium]